MIPVNELIAIFQQMYDQHWKYTAGAAERGNVDCSGAFVWAYKQFHQSIAHGSNAIARQYVKGLLPVSKAAPGMAAFKIRKPGDPKYALPGKYQVGGSAYNGDLNDYYHIGLVDASGRYVLNAQGTNAGFTRTKISTWGAVGYLKAVDYNGKGEDVKPMQTMYVTSDDGNPVRVRAKPSTSAETIKKLPVGTRVNAGEAENGWREIAFDDDNGWMMSRFLTTVSPTPTTPTDLSPAVPSFVRTLSAEEMQQLDKAKADLEEALRIVSLIVGVG